MTLYPKAVQMPLANHSTAGTLAQRILIVLHITAGASAASAIATFRASQAPHRVSAHFVVDRDDYATVYQLLPVEDTAWHASHANGCSVGIEHAAIPGNPQYAITGDQYRSSAELVAWLCGVLKIDCDRAHVKGHNEVSPQDGHFGCCSPTLDIDRVVALAKSLIDAA